ncbi:MAG: hypothetical protein H6538_01455 [Bacteroidales bacterium]|nr:hypothetical protein [Bacteroidales bacterium]
MKSKVLFLISALLLNLFTLRSNEILPSDKNKISDSIIVQSSPELFDLSVTWAREYNKVNPSTKILVKDINDFGTSKNIGFISPDYLVKTDENLQWKMVIAKEIIVPVFNSANPFSEEINLRGISQDALLQILTNPGAQTWGTLLGNLNKQGVKIFLVSGEKLESALAKFIKAEPDPAKIFFADNSDAFKSAVAADPLAIGFCRLTDLIDSNNQEISGNLKLLPIDRDGNGKLDYKENIYENLYSFSRGVWIGKYPRELYHNIYVVASSKPENEEEIAFLKWVTSDGQKFNISNHYYDLASYEQRQNISNLTLPVSEELIAENSRSGLKIILFILAGILVSGFILDYIFHSRRQRNITSSDPGIKKVNEFNETTVSAPKGLFFDKSHTWAFMEKEGFVKIGIDDFLQHVTGPITQVKMKSPGDKVIKGEQVLSIVQNGKQIKISTPVSGTIIEKNSVLEDEASILNDSPYNDGWIYLIEPTNWMREIQFLFMVDKYKVWLKSEFTRLKDFLTIYFKPGKPEFATVIMQDGGDLKDNVLCNLGPEIWEEFQTGFLEANK